MNKRKKEYKPLLFTTTLRNPERIKHFLEVILKYDTQILTNDLIDKIVFDLIKNRVYSPVYINKVPSLKSKINSETDFTNDEVRTILINSPQDHKEAGFDKGWPSRFDTFYKFLKELGFVYYEYNKPIVVSEAGVKLVKALEPGFEHLESQVFLNAFAKYQRNNPYRRIENANLPLKLLLNTITECKNRFGNESSGITKQELSLIICWKDSDYIRLVDKIESIRKLYSYTPSDEIIYEECKRELGITSDQENRFKISNIMNELPDEFIRKMRLTGLITLRGMGRFVDINSLELEKVKYVIDNFNLKNFNSEQDYFNYMKDIDNRLVSTISPIIINDTQKRQLFLNWVENFEMEILVEELEILISSRKHSKHEIFKYINNPVRLEFLTALILQKKFINSIINPNYIFDDEGLPTSHAQGGSADIECLDALGNVLFEVTLLTGAQQCIRELNSINRHLEEYIKNHKNTHSLFLAPSIHRDSIDYAEFIQFKYNMLIKTKDIPTFINDIELIQNIHGF